MFINQLSFNYENFTTPQLMENLSSIIMGFPSASRRHRVQGFFFSGLLVFESFVYFGHFWVLINPAYTVPSALGFLMLHNFLQQWETFTRGAFGPICLDA